MDLTGAIVRVEAVKLHLEHIGRLQSTGNTGVLMLMQDYHAEMTGDLRDVQKWLEAQENPRGRARRKRHHRQLARAVTGMIRDLERYAEDALSQPGGQI